MLHVQKPPLTTSPTPDRREARSARAPAQLALWQLNLLRVGYLVMGGGLAVFKWPLLFADKPWGWRRAPSCACSWGRRSWP